MRYAVVICLLLAACSKTPPAASLSANPASVEHGQAAANLMVFPEAALFEFGKAELKPEGKAKINEYRQQAQAVLSSADHVLITGYTDNVGGADRNAELSLHRAEAVRDHLVSLGANPQIFQVHGLGPDHPVGDNSTEEGRAQNRRVEVVVLGAEK